MEYSDFLEKLKQMRIKMGFSQAALSKAIGKSVTYLSQRDFRLLKDIAILMELAPEDL